MSRKVEDLVRQNITPFVQGPESDALIKAISEEGERMQEFAITSGKQLFLSTASGEYLARKASEEGVTQPDSLGIEDFLFRQLAIKVASTKQVSKVIHDVLEIFYGPDVVRAFVRGSIVEPYDLTNPSNPSLDQTLEFNLDGKRIVYQVQASDFPSGGLTAVTADQLAAAITRAIRAQGSLGYADTDLDPVTGKVSLRIISGAKGPRSSVQITGGDLVRVLGLEPIVEIVDLEFPDPPTTSWTIEKTGNNVRFTFNSGDQPEFIKINEGDIANVFGAQFVPYNLYGSYAVTTVSQGGAGIGYFELDAPNASIPGGSALVVQAAVTDVVFFSPTIRRPNYRRRYALAWESVSQTLKIYLPAVTRVIRRDLIGSAHMHLLKSTDYLNNTTWGSSSDDRDRLEVVNDRSFAFRPRKWQADLLAFGGFLSIPYSSGKDYQIGMVVQSGGLFYRAIQASGPGFGGAQLVSNPSYWVQQADGAAIDYARRDDGRFVVVMRDAPHGIQPNGGPGNLSDDSITLYGFPVVEDDPNNPFPGAYVYDPDARYVLTSKETYLTQPVLAGQSYSILDVEDSDGFPSSSAFAAFAFGSSKEEYPVPLIGTLSGKLRVDPAYKFKNSHRAKATDWSSLTAYGVGAEVFFEGRNYRSRVAGNTNNTPEEGAFWQDLGLAATVTLLSSASPVQIDPFGSDYAFYITGTTDARDYARSLIEEQMTALGIKLNIVIIYPSGIGIGNGDEPTDAVSLDYRAIIVPQGGTGTRLNDLIYAYGSSTSGVNDEG